MEFSKAIEKAQKLPNLPEEMESDLPDFLKQDPVTIAQRAHGEGGTFPGATKYDASYHCERLMIGQVVESYDKGSPLFRDVDDGERLKEIMDLSLSGKAVILKKAENILKDGTVVVWVEWAVPAKENHDNRGFLTEAELRSPTSKRGAAAAEDSDGSAI